MGNLQFIQKLNIGINVRKEIDEKWDDISSTDENLESAALAMKDVLNVMIKMLDFEIMRATAEQALHCESKEKLEAAIKAPTTETFVRMYNCRDWMMSNYKTPEMRAKLALKYSDEWDLSLEFFSGTFGPKEKPQSG